MASAQTTQTGGTQWGHSYTYDGFGNLTDQTVIKGSAPDVHVAYNVSNNLQTGDTADANGNIGSGYLYDMDNRLVQPGTYSTANYGYDVENKQVWRGDSVSGLDEITFWAEQKLATYQVSGACCFTLTSTNVYFGGKLISKSSAPVVADRLGSIGKFYPYGTERPSATANDTEKFTGYFRDASTGLDYADQRYHQPGVGRFMTADPASSSAKANDPGSWNRYSYVSGDPVNRNDPRGLCDVVIGGITESASGNSDSTFALRIGANVVLPFAGTDLVSGFAGVLASSTSFVTGEAAAVAAAINAAAAENNGPMNIFAFSGGASAFANALQLLSPSVVSQIQNVTYASPGIVGQLPTVNGQAPTVVLGQGLADDLATSGTQVPAGTTFIETACGHNASCLFAAAASRAGNACAYPSAYSDPHPRPIVQFARGVKSLFDTIALGDYDPSDPIEVVTSTITFADDQ